MKILDRARALNTALPVARLRRVLQLYRTWINAGGFDGGFSVSQHELAVALELPREDDPRVEFLFRTFAVEPSPGELRVDLVTFLTTAALLSQGSLEDKAALVFSLVDLDTEDDIAEHELALVIATCSDGLARLGVIPSSEQVSETDAVAVAYEAFEFVGADVGDKMSFSLFMQWLTFHPRPQALFDRISCIFSMCDLAKQMQRALQDHERLADIDPLRYYNWVHLHGPEDRVECIQVVTGPIIGKVTETTANILMEVDRDTLVKCIAFPDASTSTTKLALALIQELRLSAFEPAVIAIKGLAPGTTYIFRLLGVCRRDREKCVASVTTFPARMPDSNIASDGGKRPSTIERQLTIKFMNHSGDAGTSSSDQRKESYFPVDDKTRPTVTLHCGLRIPSSRLLQILERIQDQRNQDEESLDPVVYDMLKECFRGIFAQARTSAVFRSSSNYIADSSVGILGDLGLSETTYLHLQELTRRAWDLYIGALWRREEEGGDDDVCAFDLSGIAVLVHYRSRTASLTTHEATAVAERIVLNVRALPLVSNVVVVTDSPLTPVSTVSTQTAFDEAIDSICAARWTLLQALVELSKMELHRKMVLVSFTHHDGYETSIHVKDTKVNISQLVCGPSNGVFNVRAASLQEQNRGKLKRAVMTVQHGKLEHRPHIGQIVCSYEIERATTKRLVAVGSTRTSLVPLLPNRQPELTLGPVVGFVSHSSAKILIEASDDVEIDCVLTGRLIGDKKIARRRVRPHQPTIFMFEGLRSGSVYDISFPGMLPADARGIVQTLFEQSPAFRVTVVSDDTALDGSILEWTTTSSASSFLHDVSSNVLNPTIDLQTDLVVHLGCVASITHTFHSNLGLWSSKIAGAQSRTELLRAVQDCIRRHWSLSENRDVLSRGSHWFSSVGVVRTLLTRLDLPLAVLSEIREVLCDYERVGSGSTSEAISAEQISLRLQKGVVFLALDTMQAVMDQLADNPFSRLPDTLVCERQWEALEYWLGSDLSATVDADVNTIVIVCDLGLANVSTTNNAEDAASTALRASSWAQHPESQLRLLNLIFRRLRSSPTSCVLFLASDSTSAHLSVRDISTGLTFQHVSTGPVSQSRAMRPEATLARDPILVESRYMIEFEPFRSRVESWPSCHYSTVDVVPHPLGSEVFVRQYTDNQPTASLIIGPVIGRVTTRTARVLVELDRPAEPLVCILVDPVSDHRVATEANVKAFTPSILKIEGLRPGTRYHIEFDGILKSNDGGNISGYVHTPSQSPLVTEWLVVSNNTASGFLTRPNCTNEPKGSETSSWNYINTPGMRAFTAQASTMASHNNGDTLGNCNDVYHSRFNPWHHIHNEFMSDPLSSPQLLLHLGGQVDMRLAFAKDELAALVRRIAPLQALTGGLTDKQVDSELEQIRHYVRHRMQEMYRMCWSAPPMKTVLSQASNLMLLDLTADVCFINSATLRGLLAQGSIPGALEFDETALHGAASVLLGVAFELWQLYQNQLWTDLSERDLEFDHRSCTGKLAFSATHGLSRLVFMNVNPEVHSYCSKIEADKYGKGAEQAPRMAGANGNDTKSSEDQVNLFSTATWRVLEEAVEDATADPIASQQKKTASKSSIQQLVVVISADITEWGATHTYPELRPPIIRMLETVFTWKQRDNVKREVVVIGRSTTGSSMSYSITDEKTNEKIRLLAVGSISQPRELFNISKRAAKVSQPSRTSSTMKGHFSKRFTYRTTLNVAAGATKRDANPASKETAQNSSGTNCQGEPPVLYRSFASFQYLTDLRRGLLNDNLHFFPPKTPAKVVIGPVIGRMTIYYAHSTISSRDSDSIAASDASDRPEQTTCLVALPLLLEVDTSARVTCVVSDALAYQEIRVTEELTGNVPHVFTISSLLPERRYVYRFEGVANADNRRGSFHTPPPPTSLASINFICTSSNFYEHLDGSTDTLWGAIRERVALPWSGIDFVVHVGGQVPLHEAVIECIAWLTRELKRQQRHRSAAHGDNKSSYELPQLRAQVRKRLQQHYRRAWSLPNVREVFASSSNWFLRSQADVAPYFGTLSNNKPSEDSVAAFTALARRVVLEEAKRVVDDYQLLLMRDITVGDVEQANKTAREETRVADPVSDDDNKTSKVLHSMSPVSQDGGNEPSSKPSQAADCSEASLPPSREAASSDTAEVEDCTAKIVQHGNATFFMCDMRSALPDDVVTCNGRLQKPITQQERAIIGERQWQLLESALKVKKTHAFVLLLELPLILTNSEHVDKMREEQRPIARDGGRGLYDLLELTQHWVSCRRQLEQLLHVLFRWKLKRRGRDVLVVSGAMRIGIDSLVRDNQSGLSIRSVSVGPITARAEPFSLPTSGIACPEFLSTASTSTPDKAKKPSDSRFTFTHTALVSKRNYLLAQIAIQQTDAHHGGSQGQSDDDGSISANHGLSAIISASFVAALDADPELNPDGFAIAPSAHPVDLYRRPPSWWKHYVPMGKSVFWDDTVSLRAASDDELQALHRFIEEDRAIASALEVCYDKYQFAEAARLEELRSAHARQQLDLVASLRSVLAELWRLVPDQKRRLLAFVLDAYVLDLLLGHIRSSDTVMASVLGGGAVEFNAFGRLCRSVIWSACLLRLSATLYEEDRLEEARRRWERHQQQKQQQQRLVEEAADPQPASSETAEAVREARRREKLERKRAERLREAEEALAIAHEQQRLNRLADSGADAEEFARASAALETRIRALDEAKKQREAEREMRGERKQRKRAVGDRDRGRDATTDTDAGER